ncbi:MAG: hypothetical protein NUV77_11375 [Thermoguttaceae bacterium]|jgi:tetratricopeptide (TPR) repeat protein|nr:hypothetical protein [Thermoguttaceae bacterium]
MNAEMKHYIRLAKRVSEAMGYLELGMTRQALDRLAALEPLGPFEAQVAFLRGEALRLEGQFGEAARAFKKAAKKLPTPLDRPVWFASSVCYRQSGDALKAVQMLARARGAR